MRHTIHFLLFVSFISTVTAFAEPPGDFEPESRYVCHCTCGANGMSQQVRVWDNVRRVYYYVTTGVPLYHQDDFGQNYGFKVPIQPNEGCQYIEQSGCTGLYKERYDSQPVRLRGTYSNCRREAVAVRRN